MIMAGEFICKMLFVWNDQSEIKMCLLLIRIILSEEIVRLLSFSLNNERIENT